MLKKEKEKGNQCTSALSQFIWELENKIITLFAEALIEINSPMLKMGMT